MEFKCSVCSSNQGECGFCMSCGAYDESQKTATAGTGTWVLVSEARDETDQVTTED